jgi:hypothetical protein
LFDRSKAAYTERRGSVKQMQKNHPCTKKGALGALFW